MSAANASFAKLLEYEKRALGSDDNANSAQGANGDWVGLAFRIGETKLVCGLDSIQESLPLPSVTRVPGTKPFILGLANVRGDLVTVIDLGCYLSGVRTSPSAQARLLSASLRGRPVGLLVDEVRGQRNFMTSDASEPDHGQAPMFSGLISKQHRSGSETWQELDLDSLFKHPEFLDGAAA